MPSTSSQASQTPMSCYDPPSPRACLTEHGVSQETLFHWQEKYNRRIFPIFEDEYFHNHLLDILSRSPLKDVESELAQSLKDKDEKLSEDYDRARYTILESLSNLSTNEKFHLMPLLRNSSINAVKDFGLYALPSIIKRLENRREAEDRPEVSPFTARGSYGKKQSGRKQTKHSKDSSIQKGKIAHRRVAATASNLLPTEKRPIGLRRSARLANRTR